MLQTRNGKRTGLAAIRIAVDHGEEGLIAPDEALMRVQPEQLEATAAAHLLAGRQAAGRQGGPRGGQGLARGPGAATGRWSSTPPTPSIGPPAVSSAAAADFTSPEDIRGNERRPGASSRRRAA